MRLHPAVTEEEALAWLQEQIAHANPHPYPADLDRSVKSLATAMAAISKMELPDEVEPYFP